MAKCKLPGDECRHDGGCDTCQYAEGEARVETITGDPMIHGVAPEGGEEVDPVLKLIDGERKKMRDVLEIDGIGMTKDTAVHSYATVDCMLYLIRTAYLAGKNGGHGK